MESCIMKIICGNNGAMDYGELADIGSGLMDLKGAFDLVLGNPKAFSVVNFNGKQKVIAKTHVRLCKAADCADCGNLHLCKFYLLGDCKASKRRHGCLYCHDMSSEHNTRVLAENKLELLDIKELCTLLLQNDNTLLPPVCVSYNEGSGEYGKCPEQGNCRRMHICDKYLRGICPPEADCRRSHDFFEPHPFKILQDRWIPEALISSMFFVYQNIRAMKMNKSGQRGRHGVFIPSPEKTEICLYFVKGNCTRGDQCLRVHFNMPYRWEVKNQKGWSPLPNNEGIEKDYCDPAKMKSDGLEPVYFDTMTQGSSEVRRLSTNSSVKHPGFILTTEWAWYWQDEYGNWIKYGSVNGNHRLSSVSCEDLEKQYQEDSSVPVNFSTGNQAYQVNFQDMTQKNEKYGTVRNVRRRPTFLSSADAKKIKSSKRPFNSNNFKALPSHWDKSLIPETGHKKVALQSSTEEYRKILELFQKTMRGFRIYGIERIQNRSLWEVFQWQRDLMKKNNTGKYCIEKLLFHGTDSKHVDAICQQNFDWRICGTHGTAYGKGSYFARDAKYSHSYTSSSGLKAMFVCRVLVGNYTKGNASYLRPPSKDGGDVVFYDSCVDDVKNPSIFVVFEKHQVYPEYLIQYDENIYEDSDEDMWSIVNTSTSTLLPSQASSANTSSYFLPQASSTSTSTRLPSQASSTNTSTHVPSQASSTNASSYLLPQASSTSTSTRLPSQASSTSTSTRLPSQASSTNASTRLPSQASSTNASTRLPSQASSTSTSPQLPSQARSTSTLNDDYFPYISTYSSSQTESSSAFTQPYSYNKTTNSLTHGSFQTGLRSNLSQRSSTFESYVPPNRPTATSYSAPRSSTNKDCVIL